MSLQHIGPTFNICADFHGIGLGADSPDSWYEYPMLTRDYQEYMSAIVTPSAYLKLYYQTDTFEKIFSFITQKFESLAIFRKDGWVFTEL